MGNDFPIHKRNGIDRQTLPDSDGGGRGTALQGDDALEMARLREKVEGLHRRQRVAGGEEAAEVAHLRRGVAGDIHHGARTKGEELGEEGLVAALARRVDDHGRVCGRKRQPGEYRRGVAGLERGIGDAIGGGVFAGEADGGLAHLDAGHLRERGRGAQREETAAAVGIHEVPRPAGRGLVAHVAGERGQNERVVLEEIAREEMQAEGLRIAEAGNRRGPLLDDLVDHGIVVGDDAFLGVAQEERGAALVFAGREARLGAGANLGELGIDLRRRDRACRHIHDIETRPLLQKSNRLGLNLSGLRYPLSDMKMRRDLRPVTKLARRADDRRDRERDARHVLEELLHLPAFPGELLGVGQVLVLAAAAPTEERTLRRDAVRRRGEDGDEIGLGEILLVAENARPHALAGQGERHHHDPLALGLAGQRGAPEANPEIGQRRDLELQLVMIRKRAVVEFLFSHGRLHQFTKYQDAQSF